MKMQNVQRIFLISTFIISVFPAHADLQNEIGYTLLKNSLNMQGEALADGTGIQVLLAEACNNAIDADNDPSTPPVCIAWLPDISNNDFQGILINDISASTSGLFSSHATGVARLFFGHTSSIAPGINHVDAYLADHWIEDGFLHAGNPSLLPAISVNRIANHSWIGSADTEPEAQFSDVDVLHRIDWLIDRDEFLQIVGLSNGNSNPPLLSSAFNVIAVGRSDGHHGLGTAKIDSIYSAGRTRPDIVVPLSTTSSATPVISAAAALLIDAGHNNPLLSSDSLMSSTTNRAGEVIYNAERSEVVKALLMAGANRETDNGLITDYRNTAATQSKNGLDIRFGAGQINIANSYSILISGEQNSLEDNFGLATTITSNGFDYDPAFGGLENSNTEASYSFSTGSESEMFFVSLVWNIDIEPEFETNFENSAHLYDLNLVLVDVTANPLLIASSTSKKNNTENLWVQLENNRDYILKVVSDAGQLPYKRDYAIAWRREIDSDHDGIENDRDNCLNISNPAQRDTDNDGFGNRCDADLDNNGFVSFADLEIFRSRFGSHDPDADFDGNGSVSFADLVIFKSLFGKMPGHK